MKRRTFDRSMQLLAATWPDRKPEADTLAAYWLALHQLHDSVFEAAIAACLTGCTFYPKPAEIRAKAEAILTRCGVLAPSGEEAWARLLEAMKLTWREGRYSGWSPDHGWVDPRGYYHTPEAVSPLDAMTDDTLRAIGGLGRIYNASYHDLGFIRQEFVGFYGHKRQAEIEYSPELMSRALPAPKVRALPAPKVAELAAPEVGA